MVSLFVGVFASLLAAVAGLQCYQCGMYNDGVGSITPCLNETAQMKLIECPKAEHRYCIKYISEGSTVKDCTHKCSEKENWHSITYCCTEDGCNSSKKLVASLLPLIALGLLTAMLH